MIACYMNYMTKMKECISRSNRNLSTLSISEIDESCNVEELSVDWKGNDLNQSPIIINNPGECCKICQETIDCVAWLFRGAHNHCWLKYAINSEVGCDQNDCISGIIKPEAIEDVLRYQQTDDVDYERIYTSCDNSRNGMIVGAAMSACLKVKKKCGKASDENPEVTPEEITNIEWTCKYQFDTLYEISDEEIIPKSDLTSHADCCRGCQSTRSCKAWTFTTKEDETVCNHVNRLPEDKEIKKNSKGSISGIKLEFDYVCGREISSKDIARDSGDITNQERAESASECCNLCSEEWTDCVTWDFNTDNNNTCRGRTTVPASYEWDYKTLENATSGTLIPDPSLASTQICSQISWDATGMKDEALLYVPHYNMDCASVLNYGPDDPNDDCKNEEDAIDIFNTELDTLFGILIQYTT